MGNKQGKLLKRDAVTSSTMRRRFRRLCVQINTNNSLPKRVKFGYIVYENIPMLCFRCRRVIHKEVSCLEVHKGQQATLASVVPTCGDNV